MTEEEKLFECIALKGECPDCTAQSWEMPGLHLVQCKACHSTFITQQFSVRRVIPAVSTHQLPTRPGCRAAAPSGTPAVLPLEVS